MWKQLEVAFDIQDGNFPANHLQFYFNHGNTHLFSKKLYLKRIYDCLEYLKTLQAACCYYV